MFIMYASLQLMQCINLNDMFIAGKESDNQIHSESLSNHKKVKQSTKQAHNKTL